MNRSWKREERAQKIEQKEKQWRWENGGSHKNVPESMKVRGSQDAMGMTTVEISKKEDSKPVDITSSR